MAHMVRCFALAACAAACAAEWGCYEAFRPDYPHCRGYEAQGYTCAGSWCVTDKCRGDCRDCAEWRAGYVPDFKVGRCVAGSWAAGEALNAGSLLSQVASMVTGGAVKGGGAPPPPREAPSGGGGVDAVFWGFVAAAGVCAMCTGASTLMAVAVAYLSFHLQGTELAPLCVPMFFLSAAYVVLSVVGFLTSSVRWVLFAAVKWGAILAAFGMAAAAARQYASAPEVRDFVDGIQESEAYATAQQYTAGAATVLQENLEGVPEMLQHGVAAVKDTAERYMHDAGL